MSKLTLLVSPAETANNSERWFEFVVYLSRTLDRPVGLDTALDRADFHQRMHRADLVFATPQEAVALYQQADYRPLCKPANLAEEVVFVTHKDNPATGLTGFDTAEVYSAAQTTVTRLGLTLLARKGIKPAAVNALPGWMQVVKTLQRTPEACGFLSRSFYKELSPLSSDHLQVLATSRLNRAFPQLMLRPAFSALEDSLAMVLLSMGESDKGRQVLDKLGVSDWEESTPAELHQLGQLLRID